MLALQLVASLEEACGIELPGGLLYEYPSMTAIVGYLTVHQPGALLGGSDAHSSLAATLTNATEHVKAIRSRQPAATDAEAVHVVVDDDPSSATLDPPTPAADRKSRRAAALPTQPPLSPISQHHPLVLLANFLGLFVRPCLLAAGFVPFILTCHALTVYAGPASTVVAMPFVMTACVALMMHLVLLVKWVLLGRVRPGRHRLYSWFYLRWLVVHNLFRTMAVWYGPFRETFVVRCFFRAAGAAVGEGAALNTMWITDPDLVSVGAWATLGRDVNLQPSYITNGWLVLQPVEVGAEAALLHGSSVVCGGAVPARAVLEPLVCADHSTQASTSTRTDPAGSHNIACLPPERARPLLSRTANHT